MLDNGAKIGARDKETNGTLLMDAAAIGGQEGKALTEKLIQKAKDDPHAIEPEFASADDFLNARDDRDRNALHYGAYLPTDNRPLVEVLIDEGVQDDVRDEFGNLPVHLAQNEKTLSTLARPEVINQTNLDGNTPLHMYGAQGNVEMVRVALEAGSDPSLRNKEGFFFFFFLFFFLFFLFFSVSVAHFFFHNKKHRGICCQSFA